MASNVGSICGVSYADILHHLLGSVVGEIMFDDLHILDWPGAHCFGEALLDMQQLLLLDNGRLSILILHLK